MAAVAGAVLGARERDEARGTAATAPAGAYQGQAKGQVKEQALAAPGPVTDLVQTMPLERKVAQLFLLGFEGTDSSAEIFATLRELDLGGIVVGRDNYGDPALLAQAAGEARAAADEVGHVPPWVLTTQEGGEFNSLEGLPPELAPAELASADEAETQATETATALHGLYLTGVLGPVVDVGFESGSALGERVYSDDPREVAGYADAVVRVYRAERLFGAVAHFPGLGAADQPTESGPASVGLDLAQLRERDLLPFRAAIDAGVPAVVLSHALYPMNDFTQPASLTRSIATGLLRGELGFAGVAITDDLADPAITSSYSVADAAVLAIRAGADLLFVSGPADDQQAAYQAVLSAAKSGRLSEARIDEALQRALEAKQDYGLIE